LFQELKVISIWLWESQNPFQDERIDNVRLARQNEAAGAADAAA